MANEKVLKASIEDNAIVIRISIDDLVEVVENAPEANYKVTDKHAFAVAIVDTLQDGDWTGAGETGATSLEVFFDDAVIEAYSNGCDGLIDLDDED